MSENAIMIDYTSASVAASTEAELVASQAWSQVPSGYAAVITEIGVFGDSTAGTLYRVMIGTREVKQRGPPNFTAFNRDYLHSISEVVMPNEVLRLYVYNAAGGAQTYRIVIKMTLLEV